MAQKRDKTQKAWIVILAFCLFVFITLDCGLVYYEMVERQVPLKEMARPIVVLSVITGQPITPFVREFKLTILPSRSDHPSHGFRRDEYVPLCRRPE